MSIKPDCVPSIPLAAGDRRAMTTEEAAALAPYLPARYTEIQDLLNQGKTLEQVVAQLEAAP